MDGKISYVKDPYEAATSCDAIALLTEWSIYRDLDYKKIYQSMAKPTFIFDGRNILDHKNLFEIGFNVFPIGKPSLTHFQTSSWENYTWTIGLFLPLNFANLSYVKYCPIFSIENNIDNVQFANDALQDLLIAQPPVLLGLIANFTGNALQDNMVITLRRLQKLGQDIVTNLTHSKGAHYGIQGSHRCRAHPQSSPPL